MNESQPTILSGTISVSVSPENGGYSCQVSSSFNSETIRFYGETQDHAIAIALEHMAARYRNEAEQKQDGDLNIEEAMLAKHPDLKRYHVILHYEQITEAESKFDAFQNTLMGNTVVENATCTLIELSENSQVQIIE
jgi:hypothetical protein